MNYTAEQLLAMPDAERDAIAAEVCMGWRIENAYMRIFYTLSAHSSMKPMPAIDTKDWQPSQPTEKGKAQCWELAERYNLTVERWRDGFVGVYQWDVFHKPIIEKQQGRAQAAVVTAAILAVQAEQEK